MLLSNMGTRMTNGAPLLSGGEFFIKAVSNGAAVQITNSLSISVKQPKNPADSTSMQAFIAARDTMANWLWWHNPMQSVLDNYSSYVFSLYQFNPPLDSGTWANSDNASFFSAYTQTHLTAHPTQTGYLIDVFLILKNAKTMVHIYKDYYSADFPYSFAPLGLQATVVAIGVKDGALYSSFTPITIGNNQTVNFTMSETTTDSFKAILKALD